MKLKGATWGIIVDKSKATKSFPTNETIYPRGSRLNHSLRTDNELKSKIK